MARTLEELDAAVTAIEADVLALQTDMAELQTWRAEVDTQLQQAGAAISDFRGLDERIHELWSKLTRSGRLGSLDEGEPVSVPALQPLLPPGDREAIAWLKGELAKAKGKGRVR